MILAIDTSTEACSAALFDADGRCLDHRDEVIGRGHSERLAPMLAELLEGRRAEAILVGVGPGSFTGIRVGVAAAQGLAIGWDASLAGLSSLALLAAADAGAEPVAAAIVGGHGELFVQQFSVDLAPATEAMNLTPESAAKAIAAPLVVGSGAPALVALRGWGRFTPRLPSAAHALRLPEPLRSFPPRPIYGRRPDARPKAA